MTFESIMESLKKKEWNPIYFLMGDEGYFIDKITAYISANVLTEAEKSFNQTTVYGKDTTTADVINMSKRYPMMAKNQVIIVKEAQNLKKIEDIVYYAEKPLNSTILVINYKYKTLDKRTKAYKILSSKYVLFESKKLYDNKVPDWIKGYLKEKNFTIGPQESQLLTDNLGNELSKISNELDKIIISKKAGDTKITLDDIEQNIGISKDFNTFELNKAMGQKNIFKANQIVDYFGKNQKDHPIVLTISSLFHFFSKVLLYYFVPNKGDRSETARILGISPFFIDDYSTAAQKYNKAKVVKIISILREFDARSKGVDNSSSSPAELLKEMIFKILY